MAALEIPLSPAPQSFTVRLSGVSYLLRFFYAESVFGCWHLDIFDAAKNPLACGIPLLPNLDLLAPFAYLGMKGQLFVINDLDPNAPPDFESLGVIAHLVWVEA